MSDGAYYRRMSAQDRTFCLQDFDKVADGRMTVEQLHRAWGRQIEADLRAQEREARKS